MEPGGQAERQLGQKMGWTEWLSLLDHGKEKKGGIDVMTGQPTR